MSQQIRLDFVKLKSGMVVVTFFALWFSVYFNEEVEAIFSYVLIFSFGILHGSSDIQLIQAMHIDKEGNTTKNRTLFKYIIAVLSALFIFFFFPALALLFFILISGFHFGEQHWKKSMYVKTGWHLLLFTVYGLFILFMIFYLKHEQVCQIILDISGFEIQKSLYANGLILLGTVLLIQLGIYYYLNWIKTNVLEELFYLLVFFVIFSTASLLWGFCVYFIVWHSIPSLVDQMNFLYGKANRVTLLQYLKSSWIYWSISLIGLFGLYFFLKGNNQFFISVLLYFLAAITFPHVVVMSRLDD